MNACFSFDGNGIVGDYVSRRLQPLGWSRVPNVEDAAICFTYYTQMTQLEDAYFDGNGIVKSASPGTLLVDLSPSTPSLARELAAVATVNDLRPIEAPLYILDVTVPDAFEIAENVACFAAGEPDDIEEVLDVLQTLAETVHVTGRHGSAQLAKATRTIQSIANNVAAVEADALVRAARLSATVSESLEPGVQPTSEESMRLLSSIRTNSFQGTYTVEMLTGDVSAAMATADDVDLILPQLEASLNLLDVLSVIGGSDLAPAAISLMYREEQESAANGLDWTRAEELFADHVHDHEHDHDDEFGYDDLEDYGFPGGFGGYSSN